jgi:hypothetical protein
LASSSAVEKHEAEHAESSSLEKRPRFSSIVELHVHWLPVAALGVWLKAKYVYPIPLHASRQP